MTITKRSLLSVAVLMTLFYSFSLIAAANAGWWETAQNGGLQQIGNDAYQTGNPTDVREIAAKIIKVALGFLGIIFLGMVVVAGYGYMTSQGNEEKIEKAVGQIRTGIIGIIIILAAYSIAVFVTNNVYTVTR